MQAKVRPCLVLTPPAADENELAVFTLVAHTTSIRGSRWEVKIPKPFLDDGAFDVQRIVTVANVSSSENSENSAPPNSQQSWRAWPSASVFNQTMLARVTPVSRPASAQSQSLPH